MRIRLTALMLALILLCTLLCSCGKKKTDPYETAVSMTDGEVQALIDAIETVYDVMKSEH